MTDPEASPAPTNDAHTAALIENTWRDYGKAVAEFQAGYQHGLSDLPPITTQPRCIEHVEPFTLSRSFYQP